MSEGLDGVDGREGAGGAAAGPLTAGAMLREARQAQGLHIAALAATIKVAQRKLEALEADRYDELPDATFTRALAQTVCRALKIDAEPVLARLPATAVPQGLDHVSTGLNTPLRHRTVRRDSGERLGLNRPVVWATLALLIAALVVFLLPPNWWPLHLGAGAGHAAAPTTGNSVTTAIMPPTAEPARPALSPAASAAALPAPPSASASAARALPLAPSPAASATAPVAPRQAKASMTATAQGAGLAVTASDGPSWVSVRDAGGHVLISRTLQSGESVLLDGPPPLRVTIGDARAVHLSFRGQAVALPPNQTVARLELK